MFDVKYEGLKIEVTLSASRELLKGNLDLDDVLKILEQGYDCGSGRRKEEIVERCLRKGRKVIKVVVAKTSVTYPDRFKEEVWRLIHVGILTYSKRHSRRDKNET